MMRKILKTLLRAGDACFGAEGGCVRCVRAPGV